MRPAVDRICHDSKTMQRFFVFQVKSIYCKARHCQPRVRTRQRFARSLYGSMERESRAFSYAHSTHVHIGHVVASMAHIHIAVAHHVV